MDTLPATAPLPRWVAALVVLHALAAAVLLTTHLVG
jgi:hypothetical protein